MGQWLCCKNLRVRVPQVLPLMVRERIRDEYLFHGYPGFLLVISEITLSIASEHFGSPASLVSFNGELDARQAEGRKHEVLDGCDHTLKAGRGIYTFSMATSLRYAPLPGHHELTSGSGCLPSGSGNYKAVTQSLCACRSAV